MRNGREAGVCQDGGPNTMSQDSPSSVEGRSNYFFFLPAFFFVFLAATDFHLRSVLGSNTVAKIVWINRERLV
jgi:hypothetical protein